MADKTDNLVPFEKGRSSEEAKKNGRKGGIASGKARRAKKTAKQQLQMLLDSPVSEKNKATLESLGIDSTEANNQMLVVASAYRNALKGDPRSIQMVLNGFGMSESERENIKIKKQQLKLEKQRIAQESKPIAEYDYRGIPSMSIAPIYAEVLRDIKAHKHSEYVFPGGRGSLKSSFIGLDTVDLIETNPSFNALILRQVANTLERSVYNQVIWAIEQLGLTKEYTCKKSPLEIVKNSTGQKIFFAGADDPMKLKSIKPTNGYIAIVWFEELNEFKSAEDIRSIEQSALRGGDVTYKFKSFNPPRSKNNWANKYADMPRDDKRIFRSTYLDAPPEFLGKTFLDDAEYLKETNPAAYENEYLGVANGNGGNVFENVLLRTITDEEIRGFDRIYQGVDWGWYPDPFHYVRCHYDAPHKTLYIFGELRRNKTSNEETARLVREKFDVKDENGKYISSVEDGYMYGDSAEMKSIEDWRTYGMPIRAVEKGPGSVGYSMKWLQALLKIVIDPKLCPDAANEFINYEYDRDKEGNVIDGYPDRDNHAIDAVRYALFPVWKRRGQ